MRVRVLYNEDGTVSIIHANLACKKSDESEEDFLSKIFNKATPQDLLYDDIEDTDLPDKSKRDFWRGEKGVGVYLDTELEEAFDDKVVEQTEKDLERESNPLANKSMDDINIWVDESVVDLPSAKQAIKYLARAIKSISNL